MVLICYMILQDQVKKASSNFVWEPLKASQHPAKFGGHKDCGSRDIMNLVCHVIS